MKTKAKNLSGGGGRNSNLRRHSQRIYSPPPLPLGTLPRSRRTVLISKDNRLRPAGRDLPVLWGATPIKSMEAIPSAVDQLRHPQTRAAASRQLSGVAWIGSMTSRQPTGRPRPGAKPGATREQIERRERFERARPREPARQFRRPSRDVWLAHSERALCKIRRDRFASYSPPRTPHDECPTKVFRSRMAPEIVRPSAIAEPALDPTPCIRAFILKPIPCPHLPSRTCRQMAWCWSSIRLPIRTMSARSFARPRPSRLRRDRDDAATQP